MTGLDDDGILPKFGKKVWVLMKRMITLWITFNSVSFFIMTNTDTLFILNRNLSYSTVYEKSHNSYIHYTNGNDLAWENPTSTASLDNYLSISLYQLIMERMYY